MERKKPSRYDRDKPRDPKSSKDRVHSRTEASSRKQPSDKNYSDKKASSSEKLQQKSSRTTAEREDDKRSRTLKERELDKRSNKILKQTDDRKTNNPKEMEDDRRKRRNDEQSSHHVRSQREEKSRHHEKKDADKKFDKRVSERYNEDKRSHRDKEKFQERHKDTREHHKERVHRSKEDKKHKISDDNASPDANNNNKSYTKPDDGKKNKIYKSEEPLGSHTSAIGDTNEYNYDDDEFEDYDDDFESEMDDSSDASLEYDEKSSQQLQITESQKLQIKRAIELENARASSVSPVLPSSPANTPVHLEDTKRQNKNVRVLDFSSARRQQASSKAVQRSKYLTNLIGLDTVYFSLFELKPQTEYEIYMKSFGRANTAQQYTQYNDDYLDKEVSTEPSDCKTCWTQHPDEGHAAAGHEDDKLTEDDVKLGRFNPTTLHKFIKISSQIMITLLEERAYRQGYASTFKMESKSKLSDSYALYPPNLLSASRTPVSIVPVSSEIFIVTYTKPKAGSDRLKYPGLSCVWSLQKVTEPLHVLVSNGLHRCSCVSPYNPNLVFVGNDDGSLCVYDLNESADLHHSMDGHDDRKTTVRLPTYNTSGIQLAESHVSKVTCLRVLEADSDKAHISTFQIASLDENGTIIIWVVINLLEDTLSGSQTDLGLRPGGKIKLVKSAIVTTLAPDPTESNFRTYSFYQQITDTNMFFVATDTGSVYKTSRIETVSHPHVYFNDLGVPAIIGSLSFNKFNWKYFLTGSSDGVVCFYYVNRPNPVVVWSRTTRGRPIRHIEWSKFSSTIFYVMDSSNKFYFWDLSVRDSTPLIIQSFDEKGLMGFSELSAISGAESPTIVFCFKDGSLEAHHIKPVAMNKNENDIRKLQNYVTSIL